MNTLLPEKVKRKRIGLALSGGVARGPAHIGVLTVLERAGIPIDVVTGTSAGALIGALYCAGVTPKRLQELIQNFGWRHIARLVFPRRGFVSFDKMEGWLTRILGDLSFADLKIPFGIVTTDLDSGEPMLLREGRVARAVHASCAVPGFVEPVDWDGYLLCDGGASCNLPVAQARALGAEYVIGVDLMRHAMRGRLGPLGIGLGAMENLVRRSGSGIESADCLISPPLAGQVYVSFGKSKEFIAFGERAAEEKMSRIMADIYPVCFGMHDPSPAPSLAQ